MTIDIRGIDYASIGCEGHAVVAVAGSTAGGELAFAAGSQRRSGDKRGNLALHRHQRAGICCETHSEIPVQVVSDLPYAAFRKRDVPKLRRLAGRRIGRIQDHSTAISHPSGSTRRGPPWRNNDLLFSALQRHIKQAPRRDNAERTLRGRDDDMLAIRRPRRTAALLKPGIAVSIRKLAVVDYMLS